RNPLYPEHLRQPLVRVDVDPREYPRPVALDRELLQYRRKLLARPAPLGPEVDDDGGLQRALQNLGLEGRLGHIDDRHAAATRGRRGTRRAPRAARRRRG